MYQKTYLLSAVLVKFIPIISRSVFTFKVISSLFLASILSLASFAQDSTALNKNDTIAPTILIDSTKPVIIKDTVALTPAQIKKRTRIVTTGSIVIYGTALTLLYNTWYKDYPQSSFHTYNDWGEWYRMDKVGHMYSAYTLSNLSMQAWKWTGMSRKKSIWLGGISGAAYQTVVEVLDGFSEEWGWSWGDFAANIAGSGLMVAQQLAWNEQRIQMKFSFQTKKYSDPTLNERSDELFGTSKAERTLKDYNGQTYWFSTSLKSFFPKSRIPAWLQISIGTGAEGLFGGYENIGYDEAGNETFNRTDIERYRQWYLAPDIDLTKIKTNKKGIKIALYVLNILKFPSPSLEFSQGKFSWNWTTYFN